MKDDSPRPPRASPSDARHADPPGGFASRLGHLWDLFGEYVGLRRRRPEPVNDLATLARFLQTRASFVAQTSLYGYIRTRAGMRYPELFDDDAFVASLNIAKWHLWLACLSDLAVYAGGLLLRRASAPASRIGTLMETAVADVLAATGAPSEAGDAFPEHARRVRARIAGCNWAAVTDDETPFSESPAALRRWAPVVDELKALDEEIVKNSVRFRWQQVRRDLRRGLDADGVVTAPMPPGQDGGQPR